MEIQLESVYQLGLTFFGLTFDIAPQVRAAVFTQIHQIVFHGKGGYDWHTVYNMPIWLRRFTFNEIKKHYDEEKAASEKNIKGTGTKTVVGADGKVKSPEYTQQAHSNKKPANYK
jgi:hypothetical protein